MASMVCCFPPFCLCLSPPMSTPSPQGTAFFLPPVRFRQGGRGGGGPNGPIRGCWLMLHGPRSPTPARERGGGATAVAPFCRSAKNGTMVVINPNPCGAPKKGRGKVAPPGMHPFALLPPFQVTPDRLEGAPPGDRLATLPPPDQRALLCRLLGLEQGILFPL